MSRDQVLLDQGREEKILVVGAGGIGCELLKNLVLSGFHNIEVVDLDTIELSNLNRQFLFRRHHIGQSKAKVASEAVRRLTTPSSKKTVRISPHFGNIQDTNNFSFRFFQQADLVLNALDNLEARRYVNVMCLTAGIPLIESGTAGYLGQTGVILPGGESECFECTPKERARTFPVCTIRTTPTAPIHCIVWSKDFLLPQLFGPSTNTDDEQSTLEAEGEKNQVDQLAETWRQEAKEFKNLKELLLQKGAEEYAKAVFIKVFYHDIESALQMTELWETRAKPKPLTPPQTWPTFDQSNADQHIIWLLDEWIAIFYHSITELAHRFLNRGEIYFDKDDDNAMDFVAATANIRAHLYSIPMNSYFTLKSMAGNIIPAIATTNAIVAGQIVLQAYNLLYSHNTGLPSSNQRHCDPLYNAFVTYGNRRGTLFACEKLAPPSPLCGICAVDRAIAKVSLNNTSLFQFIELVLLEYGLHRPNLELTNWKEEVTILEGARILYDIDMDVNLIKTLDQLTLRDSTLIKFDFISALNPLMVMLLDERIEAKCSDGNNGNEKNLITPRVELTYLMSKERLAQRQQLLELVSNKNHNDDDDDDDDDDLDQEESKTPSKMAKSESITINVKDDLEIL